MTHTSALPDVVPSEVITGDPLPYGVPSNRKALEDIVGHALAQGIITKPVSVDDLFAPSTRSVVA